MDNKSFSDWLSELGARQPTPGGGAVAGINGAIATAQLKMIWEYSKKDQFSQEINFQDITDKFLKLSSDDESAYKEVRDAYSSNDKNKIELSLVSAIKPSEEIILNAEKIYEYCENNFSNFNKNLMADLVVSLSNLLSATESALAMIIINKNSMNNEENKKSCEMIIDKIKVTKDRIIKLKAKSMESI